jgi:Periplasmic binding protein
VSVAVGSVLKPAGFDNAKGVVSAGYLKDPTDPAFKDDKGIAEWKAFMTKYYPDGDQTNNTAVYGYSVAATMAHVLKQAGDNLTRENVMKQAASIKDYSNPVMLDGVKVNTSATDFFPIEQMQLMKFDGAMWGYFGKVIDGAVR